jgi:hypothetical protein
VFNTYRLSISADGQAIDNNANGGNAESAARGRRSSEITSPMDTTAPVTRFQYTDIFILVVYHNRVISVCKSDESSGLVATRNWLLRGVRDKKNGYRLIARPRLPVIVI